MKETVRCTAYFEVGVVAMPRGSIARTPARKLPAEVGAGEEEDDDQAGQEEEEEEDDGEGDARVVVVEEVREQVPVAEDGEG